jgi:acyl-CoA thioesterase I
MTATAFVGAACSGASAATQPTSIDRPLRIVALGDSLTSGRGISKNEAYPAILEKTLKTAGLPYIVSNHGVSGDTTADALRRLTAALDEQPSIMIVALGANDGLRGVPVATVRSNLEKIIEAAQARHIDVLLCGMEALPVLGWQYTIDFHQIYPTLAAKYNVPLVPFMLAGVIGNQRLLQPDMVHPNAAGAAEIAAAIWPYLQPLAARDVVSTN